MIINQRFTLEGILEMNFTSSRLKVDDESSKLITAPTFCPQVISSTPQTATSFMSGCSINILSTCNAPTLYPPVLELKNVCYSQI